MRSALVLRVLVVGAAAPAFVACASMRQSSNSAAGSLALLGTPAVPALDAHEVSILERMSDPEILGHLALSDSVEVVMARLALQRSKDDEVVAFARQMIVDHSTSLEADRSIARQTGLGMHTMVGELNMSHMGSMVDSIAPTVSEINFDHNYIISQVQMHQHVLAELQTLQTVARDAAVRQHIADVMPVVARHLAKAHDMAVKRAYLGRDQWKVSLGRAAGQAGVQLAPRTFIEP